MCGRLAVTLPGDAMAQLFAAAPSNALPKVPNYNVCPTTNIHVVMHDDGRRLVSMRWGFVPEWYESLSGGPLLINARAETLAQKPAFRGACRGRRCLVPVNGYYEWTKDALGQRWPWYFHAQQAPLALAGIWQSWGVAGDEIRSCAIVTTQAIGDMAKVHHRVPVVVAQADWGLWLGEAGFGAAALMQAPPSELLSFHQVGREVNSSRASGADLISPLI